MLDSLFFVWARMGCICKKWLEYSDPEPVEADAVVAEVGLALEDYKVHENGAIEVYSKVDYAEEDVL